MAFEGLTAGARSAAVRRRRRSAVILFLGMWAVLVVAAVLIRNGAPTSLSAFVLIIGMLIGAVAGWQWHAALEQDVSPEELARELDSVGATHSGAGRIGDAVDAIEASAAIRRQLAREDPGRFVVDLARTLADLGVLYWNVDRDSDAERVWLEALDLDRHIYSTGARSSEFLTSYRTVLHDYGDFLESEGRDGEARRLREEHDSI